MQNRELGRRGPAVSALGLGCMGMSDFYAGAEPDEARATIREAVEAGVTLLDTGDFYGMGHNELLLTEALRTARREELFIAVKFGAQRDPEGRFIGIDCSPTAVKNSLAYSLQRLGTDYVDLYQPARVDPAVPIEDTVGAIRELHEAGHVRYLGLSEASVETIRRAHAIHPVTWLQIENSLMSRGIEAEILPTCRALGIAISAYGVLSRGLLSAKSPGQRTGGGDDLRHHLPRFQSGNLDNNLALVQPLHELAEEKGATVAQLATAWVLAQGDDIIPLIGARRRAQLRESLASLDVRLDQHDLRRIEASVRSDAVAGARYDAGQMALLDSEQSMGSTGG